VIILVPAYPLGLNLVTVCIACNWLWWKFNLWKHSNMCICSDLGTLLIFFTLSLFYVGIHAVGDSWHEDFMLTGQGYQAVLGEEHCWAGCCEMCKRLVCMMVPYLSFLSFCCLPVGLSYIVLLCRICSPQAVCQGASLCFVCNPCSHCSCSLSWEQEEPWASTAFQAQGIILCTCFTS
jgi:hypothetical protein